MIYQFLDAVFRELGKLGATFGLPVTLLLTVFALNENNSGLFAIALFFMFFCWMSTIKILSRHNYMRFNFSLEGNHAKQ